VAVPAPHPWRTEGEGLDELLGNIRLSTVNKQSRILPSDDEIHCIHRALFLAAHASMFRCSKFAAASTSVKYPPTQNSRPARHTHNRYLDDKEEPLVLCTHTSRLIW
jgi:hypothetical protein